MMAMQLLRTKPASANANAVTAAAADCSDMQSVRQQLAESQALVLELQLEQVPSSHVVISSKH
jgi:hypothetical protein